ncbi:hypothetical protein ACFL5P_03100 [candidate division KSB1 bacterium]
MQCSKSEEEQNERPPEYSEIRQASQIRVPEEALKEFEALKEKYPNSTMMNQIDNNIVRIKVNMSTSLEEITEIQKDLISKTEGSALLNLYSTYSRQILNHSEADNFNDSKVIQAITEYADAGKKLAKNEKFLESLSERNRSRIARSVAAFDITLATAYSDMNNGAKTAEHLDIYINRGGSPSGQYHFLRGRSNELLGKKQEALESYMDAVVERHRGSAREKAEELYKAVNGSLSGFEGVLEKKLTSLPFHPKHFSPTDWEEKTVVAELFTGSECPPCVAADFGFDGLLDAYESKFLVVLEYHLPIPDPDPIMNPASKLRQDYYGVRYTPTAIIDGKSKFVGGSGRSGSENKFNQYSESINEFIIQKSEAVLKADAKLSGDNVTVIWETTKDISTADYNFALIQNEEKYAGSNGIIIHKMVVRDFKTTTDKNVVFNLSDIEKATEKYLQDFEKERDSKFDKYHNKIDRSQLKVVFFMQDKETQEMINAVVTDVK